MAERDLTLPSRAARLRGAARGLGLADFWQWWRGQLDPLLPQALRTAVARRRMRPVVAFAGDHATLWQPAVEAGIPVMRPVATIALGADPDAHAAEGRAALAQGRDRAQGARVVLSLGSGDVLRRRLSLPAAVEENLRQALAYDLDRHTPFKPQELHFDAVVVDRAPARGTITVDLATARRTTVDPLLRHLAAWGAQVVAVVPEPPAQAARSRLNLLPMDARTSRALWRRWQLWVPLVAIAAALLAAVVIPLWQEREEAIALGRAVDEARARAAISETLRAEVNAKVNDYNFALERKYAFPGALAVVDTVSKVLPDDTWLTQFEIKTLPKGKDTQREIMLRGETANAGKLVGLLEETQMFMQAAQRGPTTKIQPGPGEIFDLGAQLQRRPAPSPTIVAVDAAGTPAPPGNAAPAAAGAGTPTTPTAAPTAPATPAAGNAPATAPATGHAPATGNTPANGTPAAAASAPASGPTPAAAKATSSPPASSPLPAATPPAPAAASGPATASATPAATPGPGAAPPGGTIHREARP